MKKNEILDDARDRMLFDTMEELATAMRLHGVTQIELARRLGTTRSSISRMMSGRQNTTLATLHAAFHALGYQMQVKAEGMNVPAKVRKQWERQGLTSAARPRGSRSRA